MEAKQSINSVPISVQGRAMGALLESDVVVGDATIQEGASDTAVHVGRVVVADVGVVVVGVPVGKPVGTLVGDSVGRDVASVVVFCSGALVTGAATGRIVGRPVGTVTGEEGTTMAGPTDARGAGVDRPMKRSGVKRSLSASMADRG